MELPNPTKNHILSVMYSSLIMCHRHPVYPIIQKVQKSRGVLIIIDNKEKKLWKSFVLKYLLFSFDLSGVAVFLCFHCVFLFHKSISVVFQPITMDTLPEYAGKMMMLINVCSHINGD